MSSPYKTPGVYIIERNAFANSVVGVASAIPVFIGHTEKALDEDGNDVSNKPVRIHSMLEYRNIFGAGFPPCVFEIQPDASSSDFNASNGSTFSVSSNSVRYRMPAAIRFFYANGGNDCYILSIGDFNSGFDKTRFINAIDLIQNEHEITLLLVPEAVELEAQDSYDVLSYMIQHCGETKNKFAILDIPGGYEDLNPFPNCVDNFRDKVSAIMPENNSYAATYYPWLNTTVYHISDISYLNISEDSYNTLADLIQEELTAGGHVLGESQTQLLSCFRNNGNSDDGNITLEQADASLRLVSRNYESILRAILKKLALLPPSSAMAGIYAEVDGSRGVWKAPANVSVASVTDPEVPIDNDQQQDLNVPISGKAVNAIRSFPGQGVLVWGARTLDGNSLDFRYINVRRTLIYLEQSIISAVQAYVFEPNDANTWAAVNAMISNFLTQTWKQGALVGAKPDEAFSVHVGLGTTMTAQDILDGTMIVSVAVAISHPAEFIIFTIQQQMQTS